MKKIFLVVFLAGCLSLMLAGAAAAVPYNENYAFPGREVGHYELVNGGWVGHLVNDYNSLARAFATEGFDQDCNARYWTIPVQIYASVAQWVDIFIDGTDWHWFVMKPGTYAADCIAYTIRSNQEIKVDFDDFNNLEGDKSETDVEIWYNHGELTVLPLPGHDSWLTPAELNLYTYTFPDEHHTIATQAHGKLWSMIKVVECNSACEYFDFATIKLELLCQKAWVKDSGDWTDKT